MKEIIQAIISGVLLALAFGAHAGERKPTVEVYKSPTCSCCKQWITYLEQSGFAVKAHDVPDVNAARRTLGMPQHLGACHTAKVGNYLVEGHVPAVDIRTLLKERPVALGIAVPGMPPGSPGMETPHPVNYETLLVRKDGSTQVFAKH